MSNRTGTTYTAETLAKFGINAELLVGDGASPEGFEAIAGIRVINPGQKSSSIIDTTHLRSPDRHTEKAPGRRDSDAFEFTAIWMPDEESQSNAGGGSGSFQNGGLFALERTQEIRNFLVRFDDGGSPVGFEWPFRGFISALQPGEIVDNNVVLLTGSIMPVRDYSASLP